MLVAGLQDDEQLNRTLFRTYVFLVKAGKPVGPRDLMRGANLSSPSVAYRNLQKLTDLGLVAKDEYGNYIVKEKVHLKGYIWVGKTLMPSFAVYGFVFLGILLFEIGVLIPHLLRHAPIQESFWFFTAVTIVAAVLFLVEALRSRNKPRPLAQ
jgi:hypothetical protein